MKAQRYIDNAACSDSTVLATVIENWSSDAHETEHLAISTMNSVQDPTEAVLLANLVDCSPANVAFTFVQSFGAT